MRTTARTVLTLALGAILGASFSLTPATAQRNADPEIDAISVILDDFHDAAATGDFDRYFGHFAAGGRFLGTDKTERWTVEEFKAFARPLFEDGVGWVYIPERGPGARSIVIGESGDVAWFDELLQGAKYGTSRGTGTMVRENGAWKIGQYHLSFPIPNDMAETLTTAIKEFEADEARMNEKSNKANR